MPSLNDVLTQHPPLTMPRCRDLGTMWLAGCHGFSPCSKGISQMNLRNHSNQNNGPGTRKSRSMRLYKSDSNSEDIDAENAGAATTCGRLTAMDSAPAPKSTSQKHLRNHSNQNPGSRTRKSRSTQIPIQRILMLRMQGLQHCVASRLPWIEPLLQKQLLR